MKRSEMRPYLIGLGASLGLTLALSAGALAAPPGKDLNPQYGVLQSGQSGNWVAIHSSTWIHNGQNVTLGQGGDPSHGTRGAEIQGFLGH